MGLRQLEGSECEFDGRGADESGASVNLTNLRIC